MSTPQLVAACAAAALAGAAVAWVYLALLRRQVTSATAGSAATMLGGFVLRLAIFAGPLAVAMWLDHRVGIAFAVGFTVPRMLLVRKFGRDIRAD
jgi:hypothetical protein